MVILSCFALKSQMKSITTVLPVHHLVVLSSWTHGSIGPIYTRHFYSYGRGHQLNYHVTPRYKTLSWMNNLIPNGYRQSFFTHSYRNSVCTQTFNKDERSTRNTELTEDKIATPRVKDILRGVYNGERARLAEAITLGGYIAHTVLAVLVKKSILTKQVLLLKGMHIIK